MTNCSNIIKNTCLLLLIFMILGANSYSISIPIPGTSEDIVNCLDRNLELKNYSLNKQGTIFPMNIKEFAVHDGFRFVGSYWIEILTEGRQERLVSMSDPSRNAKKNMEEVLYECKIELSESHLP